MKISYATTSNIAAIAAVEVVCFPPEEAATEKEFLDIVQSITEIIFGCCVMATN